MLAHRFVYFVYFVVTLDSTSALPSRDLVLIGAGHTNLHIVRQWRMRPIADVRLTLISPFSRATYSGMLPGTLAGLYTPDDMEIDLYRFAESCGARLIVDEVIGFDPTIRRVLFADRPPLRYDVASIGIGSVPGQREIWERNPHVLSIKPMATFATRLAMAIDAKRQAVATQIEIVIVGGGAGGVEVAFGLDVWTRAKIIAARVSLVDANADILQGYSAGTVQRAQREFERRGIAVHLGKRIKNYANGQLTFEEGTTLPADIVIWATSAAPPPVLENVRLPKTDDGFLAVRSTLQTTADYPIFVVGDTASFVDKSVPKAGVYAVREGPILWDNINRLFAGRELIEYQPQRGFLSLLSLGDERALLEYRGFSAEGRWAWRLKDYIDRKFMRMYQDYQPNMTARSRPKTRVAGVAYSQPQIQKASSPSFRGFEDSTPATHADHNVAPKMRCGGCGGKVGARVLAAALERLPIPRDARTLRGLDHPDDAAVIDKNSAPVEILSVDFFEAFLDDPYLVGRIAAINALSDVWAMGAEPLGAMAMAGIPEGSESQQTELLYQLLAGGLRELTTSGATLWGGHTIELHGLTIGYSVAGKLDGREPFTKGNLRAGDRLILTKPLGTAMLLAAHRQCLCRARWMDALIKTMLCSNAAAAKIARDFDVGAVTDVTGFGLAGHLAEMLRASGVSARLSLEKIPLLEGFAELNSTGVRSSLDTANRDAVPELRWASDQLATHPASDALFDPQTSGGLLIGIAADRAEALLAQLRKSCPEAAIIGEVVAAGSPMTLEIC